MLRLAALALVAVAVVAAPASALNPIQATNVLLGEPWLKFSKQLERDAESALEAYEGKEVAGGGGSVGITYRGVGVTASWRFGVKATNVSANVDLSAPPGMTAASPTEIAFAAPRNGGWSFGFQAIFKPFAWVKVGGTKIWKKDYHVPFAIGIKDFRIPARAQLSSVEPDRPRLVSASITPFFKLGGAGIVPGIIPVTFNTTVEQGKVTLQASAIVVPLAEFGFANARFNGDLTIVLRPSPNEPETDVIASGNYLMRMSVRLQGRLSTEIRYVPSSKESFSFDLLTFEATVPSTKELDDFLRLTRQEAPRSWGEGNPRGWVAPPPDGVDYAAPAAALEAGVDRHLPYGAVLSIDCKVVRADPRNRGACNEYTWAGDEDSAIWTGHYLAAEAFRYGSGDTAALERVSRALAGIERLFWVTGDTAIAEGKRSPVSSPRGILSRTAAPAPTRGRGVPPVIPYSGKPLHERKCYYERSEGGWAAGTRTYPTLAAVPKAQRESAKPVGRIWRGWGCGDDHPVSKDQYTGVFYGLAVAHQLVPDAAIQARIRVLVRDALDYFIANNWNVKLPPADRYETTFLGDFAKQLAFLRVGATVLGGTYRDRYVQVAPASSSTWIPTWFSSVDPVLQYYKFNLSHAALSTALLLEDDAAVRAGYAQAHALMWRAVRHHRNAYFQLLRVLAQPAAQRASFLQTKTPWLDPTMTVGKEIRSLLYEWIQRYEAVKSSTGMPTGAVGDPGFQATQLSAAEVADFVGFDGSIRKLAVFALPLTARTGSNKDFIWQRDPFDTSYRGSVAGCNALPPSPEDVSRCGGRPNRIHPGVDYLLAYWLARYVGAV